MSNGAAPHPPYPHPSYTSIFRGFRVIGDLLRRPGFRWETEMRQIARDRTWLIHQSCNAALTPFIADVAQQAFAAIGEDVPVIGGPESCCGAAQHHLGDEDLAELAADKAQRAFGTARPRTVLSICPDCDDVFTEHMLSGRRYQQMNISNLFVAELERFRPMMKPVNRRVILHIHAEGATRIQDAQNMRTVLQAIPGLELITARHSAGPGIHCQTTKPMPPDDQRAMFDEARTLGADTIVVPYHSCYRQHCKMQLTHGIEVVHYIGLLGEALGLTVDEAFKRLRLVDDLDRVTDMLLPLPKITDVDRDELRTMIRRCIFC